MIARLRSEARITQSTLAAKSGLDQSRISRIERGEGTSSAELNRVFDALEVLGMEKEAKSFKEYADCDWAHIEPPSFWNPERACLETADETLDKVATFLEDEERSWPLLRQIEKHRDSLLRVADYLVRLDHNIAFIGDLGVGKSTAISFIFNLLVPPSIENKAVNQPVLETGSGGTTICEVHIKAGPEYGISLLPMSDRELRDLVADFCTAKWVLYTDEKRKAGEHIAVSREAERAIRNMSGLGRKRETAGGKITYHDPVNELVKSSQSEEEFRIKTLGLMSLENRTRRELWYDGSTQKHPMEWMRETYKAVNNGRLKNVPLPKSIDLLMPNFGQAFGEFEIAIIDTKGVDDVTVREDLDRRLKDPRTAVVFCTRFNDAPGTCARMLLQHMRQTFSERVDTGKVLVLALPRAEEALATKDDMGEQALDDTEGYDFKRMQVEAELAAGDLAGVPIVFYNVVPDDAEAVRAELFDQLSRMRKTAEKHLSNLSAAAQHIIDNHEEQELIAAIEEVAKRLNTFLEGNKELGARENQAYAEAVKTVREVRHASTLWASARRNGEYSGLNFLHLVGVGAARDARLRSESWFSGLDAFLNMLNADEALVHAKRSIEQISANASMSKRTFLEAVQRGGVEVYREPLSHAAVWTKCTSEWGEGPGFTRRVANHLEKWFTNRAALKERLEEMIRGVWEQSVIAPMLRLAEESAPELDPTGQAQRRDYPKGSQP